MFVSPSEPVTPGSLLFRGERGAFKVVPIFPILHEQSSVRSILFYKCVFQLTRKNSRMSSSYTGMEESVLIWNKHTPLFQMGKIRKGRGSKFSWLSLFWYYLATPCKNMYHISIMYLRNGMYALVLQNSLNSIRKHRKHFI